MLTDISRAQTMALTAVDAGYKKTTPFFISYMENAKELREAGCYWVLAMVHFAADDRDLAVQFASQSLELNAGNLYAELIVEEIW